MDVKNQIRGAKNRAQGNFFENYIDAGCTYYSINNIAEIEKTPEPMKVIKSLGGGKFVAVFTKKAQPDYKGIASNGKGIMFDAKHTEADRIEKKALSKEQEEKLLKYAEMNGMAFVLVSIKFERVFRIPISVWKNMKEIFGHQYMTPEEMKKYEVHFNPLGALDFLEGLYETK